MINLKIVSFDLSEAVEAGTEGLDQADPKSWREHGLPAPRILIQKAIDSGNTRPLLDFLVQRLKPEFSEVFTICREARALCPDESSDLQDDSYQKILSDDGQYLLSIKTTESCVIREIKTQEIIMTAPLTLRDQRSEDALERLRREYGFAGGLMIGGSEFNGHVNVSFSPDGAFLAFWGARETSGKTLKIMDTRSRSVIFSSEDCLIARCKIACFSPDNTLLAIGDMKGMVTIIDIAKKIDFYHFCQIGQLEQLQISGLRFSPDGRSLVFGDNDGRIQIIDIAKAKKLFSSKSIK